MLLTVLWLVNQNIFEIFKYCFLPSLDMCVFDDKLPDEDFLYNGTDFSIAWWDTSVIIVIVEELFASNNLQHVGTIRAQYQYHFGLTILLFQNINA